MVDDNDLSRFVGALDGSGPPLMTAANLQSFDFDHDNDVDCDDWPAFAAAFQASSGFAPQLPLPDVPALVAALLGDGERPCLADMNGDGTADGADIVQFVERTLLP